jgi:hypothetical protein
MKKIPLAIKPKDLVNHKADIQRKAIEFYKIKDYVFPGQSRRARWESCIWFVADCWMRLGPQSFGDGSVIILQQP